MISVIVPIYNVEPYLAKCLDSLKQQTYKQFEVLMIDDGSTDDSALIAYKYATQDRRFRYVYQDNEGQGSARNHGIDLSSGEYLSFVDSDDWVLPTFLQELINLIEDHNADMATCSALRCFENGRTAECTINKSVNETREDIDKYLVSASFSVWNKLYRRDLFTNLRFIPRLKYEDYALMPQVYARCNRIASTSAPLYMYFFRRYSTTNTAAYLDDMLRAHWILNDSEFGQSHKEIMAQYFVRQVMGSYIWKQIQDFRHFKITEQLLDRGEHEYPDLNLYVRSKWGRYLLRRQYLLAALYAVVYDKPKVLYKSILSFFSKVCPRFQ